jgi:hypothetical protein
MFGFGNIKVDKLGKRFHNASENNNIEAMKQALIDGADPNKPCNELGWYPIHNTVWEFTHIWANSSILAHTPQRRSKDS